MPGLGVGVKVVFEGSVKGSVLFNVKDLSDGEACASKKALYMLPLRQLSI